MAGLRLNHIYKKYGENNIAVKDFHLEIEENEFLVLVGPSGCGKSTTLRMIAGLEDISEGELYIGDRLVNEVAPKDRDIAMVFQSYALYPHMNVYENMAFGLKLRKFPKAEIDQRVKEAAQILDIEHLLDRKPKALSGGQRQRVALGRAIVRNAKVFLMDEPLSNLDAKLRVQMRAEISKLHKKLQTTVVYVTHDQTEAMTMGDRIVVMKLGEVQQAASPDELYNNPINMFVGGFIGSPAMNFIEGTLAEKAGNVVFQAKNMELVMPAERANLLKQKNYIGKPIVLGIRPEDIRDEETFIEDKANGVIDVLVDVAENLGSEMFLYLEGVGGQTVIARVSGRSGVKEGENVKLAVDIKKIQMFDKETEAAIFYNPNYSKGSNEKKAKA